MKKPNADALKWRKETEVKTAWAPEAWEKTKYQTSWREIDKNNQNWLLEELQSKANRLGESAERNRSRGMFNSYACDMYRMKCLQLAVEALRELGK